MRRPFAISIVLTAAGLLVIAGWLVTGGSDEPSGPDKPATAERFVMPEEGRPHAATWLQWPHEHQYGVRYRDSIEPTWLAMTEAIVPRERVKIIVYDEAGKARLEALLADERIPTDDISIFVKRNDDVWVRDNGPIYVRDESGRLAVTDWKFNGWGGKEGSATSDTVPSFIAEQQDRKLLDLNQVMVLEGGAVEVDGRGTLMATRSSILNPNRNPGLPEARAEAVFAEYLGADNVIWLDGRAGLEITDMHIDGFARFADEKTIVTMADEDLSEWQVPEQDIETLAGARDADGQLYERLVLPLTARNVSTTSGRELGYRGSYVNYYVANGVVLVPNYRDANDAVANRILQEFYPDREVIGIDVRNLYSNGGMIHCVTQQEPAAQASGPEL